MHLFFRTVLISHMMIHLIFFGGGISDKELYTCISVIIREEYTIKIYLEKEVESGPLSLNDYSASFDGAGVSADTRLFFFPSVSAGCKSDLKAFSF